MCTHFIGKNLTWVALIYYFDVIFKRPQYYLNNWGTICTSKDIIVSIDSIVNIDHDGFSHVFHVPFYMYLICRNRDPIPIHTSKYDYGAFHQS